MAMAMALTMAMALAMALAMAMAMAEVNQTNPMQKIKLEDDVIVGKEGMTKKEHFRLTLMEWRATVNATAKMRPTGSDHSDLHEALANKIFEYFKTDVDKLVLWTAENSVQIEDNLFFEEQDALTLAMNLVRFLDK